MTPYMKTIFQQKKNWNFDQNQWVGPLKQQKNKNSDIQQKTLFNTVDIQSCWKSTWSQMGWFLSGKY